MKTSPKQIAQILNELISTYYPNRTKIVLLCIGSDRSTGDAFGPLVGTFLHERGNHVRYQILGTLAEPIHAKNIEQTIQSIRLNQPDTIVISIDAGLGTSAQVGSIYIGIGSIRPGKAVDKEITSIGDIHIIGVINTVGQKHVVLQSSRLSLVYNLAKLIKNGLVSLSQKTHF